MESLGLLTFLQQNPSPENLKLVFPSPDDIKVTPELFMRVAELGVNDRNERTVGFFKRFLSELHSGKIGEFFARVLKMLYW
jgi:hypothetical protein